MPGLRARLGGAAGNLAKKKKAVALRPRAARKTSGTRLRSLCGGNCKNIVRSSNKWGTIGEINPNGTPVLKPRPL